MSHSINWDLLEDQYLSDGEYREKLSKMVTIVDEAFLAGKKFARTYSQNIDIPQEKTDKNDTKKELDITYKENAVPDNLIDNINKVPRNVDKSQIENIHEELKMLLDENKISLELYNKLTSNEKFVLEPTDIDAINNMSEPRIKEVLLKCKVGKSICKRTDL